MRNEPADPLGLRRPEKLIEEQATEPFPLPRVIDDECHFRRLDLIAGFILSKGDDSTSWHILRLRDQAESLGAVDVRQELRPQFRQVGRDGKEALISRG